MPQHHDKSRRFSYPGPLGTIIYSVIITLIFAAHAQGISIATITNNPSAEITIFQPLADYLTSQLTPGHDEKVTVIMAENIEQMAGYIRDGKADIFIDSPYPSLKINVLTETELALRRWKDGRSSYDSVIMVHRDSKIRSLLDLANSCIALENPYSTSGYLLPLNALHEVGIYAVQLDETACKSMDGPVGYLIAFEAENMLSMVIQKRVDAVGIGSHEIESLHPHERDLLIEIHRTKSVPRHLVSVRKGLDGKLRTRIIEILSSMDKVEKGRQILAAFEQTTRFDTIPEQDREMLLHLKDMIHYEKR